MSNNSKRRRTRERENKERKRKLDDRKPREETERKIGLSGPFFALRVWWSSKCRGNVVAISAPQHTTRTRHSLEKRTFARGNTFRTRRERFYSRVCFSKQRRPFKHKCAGFGSLSKGRKRGLKNVKAGLEFQSRARANAHDANEKNKFSFPYLLASIDVRV